MTLAAGSTLGPYEVIELLGVGGMGEVYRARDPRLGRDVAVKVLPAEVAGDAQRLNFFEREARAVAALNHPNILTVFDVGTHDGAPYVVTELLEGENFREVVSRRTPTVQQVLTYGLQAARGLEAAHGKDVVHRDLKPENLFLTTDGRVKVLDFGLAKLVRREEMATDAPTPSRSNTAGQVVGTVAYMSPEQARGQPVDPRSDVFSFGVVLYELLGGTHPFHRETMAATLTAIVEETPADLESLSRGIPPAVGGIVRRCLEKPREERYGSGHDVAMVLEAVLAAPTGTAALLEVEERSPYPGLNSFTEKDAGIFFGREREIEELWGRIRNRRLLAVIGPSGVGKTSFVRAGVVAGRPEGWAAIVCTPGTQPFRGLGLALVRELAGDVEALERILSIEDQDTAIDLFSRWRRGHGEALLVVDQFEELFTLNPPEVQERFAALLGLLASEADVHVVLSLRDDFLIRCHEQPALARVFEHLTPLLGLTDEGLRRALVEPAKKQGYRFDDDTLVEEMVSLVEGVRGALPLLAFAAARLWEKRDREGKLLTREAYQEIAGVEGALAQHAEATMDRIGSERQGVVRELFRNLVTAQGTRAVIDREELLSALPSREAAEEVLRQLIDARLLTSYEVESKEDEPSRHRVEIVHESLLKAWPRLVRWQTQDEDSAQLRDQLRQAARLWDERGRSADLLWSGAAYREFEVWRERYPGGLTETEDAFARGMATHAERKRRRRRLAVAVVVAVLAAGLGAMSVLWSRSETAREREAEARLEAEAGKLLALGQARFEEFPSEALAFTLASLETKDSPEARLFALEILSEAPPARILPLGNEYLQMAFNTDGAWIAVAGNHGEVPVWPRDGGPPKRIPGGPRTPQFAPRDELLAVGNPSSVQFWSFPEGELVRTLEFEAPTSFRLRAQRLITFTGSGLNQVQSWPLDGGAATPLGSLDFTGVPSMPDIDPTGTWLAYARGRAVLLRRLDALDTEQERVVGLHPAATKVVRFTPSGERIAALDESGEIRIWDLARGAEHPVRTLRLSMAADDWKEVWAKIAFDARGSRLALRVKLRTLAWDLAGPPDADPLELPDPEWPWGLAFDPSGQWLVREDKWQVRFWPAGHRLPSVLRGHTSTASLTFTPDSRWIVSASVDGTVRLWPLAPSAGDRSRVVFEDRGLYLESPSVDPSGRNLLFAARIGGEVFVVPLSGGAPRRLPGFAEGAFIFSAVFGPRGRLAAAGTFRDPRGNRIRVWDLESGDVRVLGPVGAGTSEDPDEGGVSALAFTPEGQLLSYGNEGLRRWDLERGTSDLLWRNPSGKEYADMGASADGRYVLTTAFDEEEHSTSEVILLDLERGTSQPFTSHGERVQVAALDPRGETVVTGDADGVVRVGPMAGGESHLLLGHTDSVYSVAVSPDGAWVAAAALHGPIRLWPMPDVTKPPFHTLPYEELLDRLRAFTNLRAVPDEASPAGYRIEVGPFPGWETVPTW